MSGARGACASAHVRLADAPRACLVTHRSGPEGVGALTPGMREQEAPTLSGRPRNVLRNTRELGRNSDAPGTRIRRQDTLPSYVVACPAPPTRLKRRSRTTSRAALSSRRPRKRGWRRRPSRVHSVKPTWATSSRLDPGGVARARPASANGGSCRGAAARAARPRSRSVALRRSRCRPCPRSAGGRPRSSRASSAPSSVAAAPRRGVAADHELLLGRALELQPVARAAVRVGAVGALGDQPLPALAARLAEELLAVAVAVRREAHRRRRTRARARSSRLARAQRAARCVSSPVEPQHVEDVEERPCTSRSARAAAAARSSSARRRRPRPRRRPRSAWPRRPSSAVDDLREARVEAQVVARQQPHAARRRGSPCSGCRRACARRSSPGRRTARR